MKTGNSPINAISILLVPAFQMGRNKKAPIQVFGRLILVLQRWSETVVLVTVRNYPALIADLDGLVAIFFTDSTKSSRGNGLGKTTSKPES